MERKQLIELLGGIFIGVIFLSSYISRINYNNFNQTSTTTVQAQTVFAVGTANAVIVSYYPGISVSVLCKNSILTNSTLASLSDTLATLENNNSISNFYNINNKVIVTAGNLNSRSIYNYTSSKMNTTALNCTVFSSSVTISLPQSITMHAQSGKANVQIPPGLRNYSLSMNFTKNMGSQVPVKVSALLYLNGTISGQLYVVRA